jgi:hypothetical protein
MRFVVLAVALGMATLLPSVGFAQAGLEGPTGVCLTPLAYTLPGGVTQASMHFVDLGQLGTLTTVGVSKGLHCGVEVGLTREALAVGGTVNTNVLHAKWAAVPEKPHSPALSVGAVLRDPEGSGGSTSDFYLVASKILPGKTPVILSANARSTDGIGFGLLGESDRETKYGGFVGFVVHPKLILGWEAAQQPGGARTWSAFVFRYSPTEDTNIDGGIADLGPGIDDQLVVVLTRRF